MNEYLLLSIAYISKKDIGNTINGTDIALPVLFVIFTLHRHLIEVHNLLCEACELDPENVNMMKQS